MTDEQIDHLRAIFTMGLKVFYQGRNGWQELDGRIVYHDDEMKAIFVGGDGHYIDLYAVGIDELRVVADFKPTWPQ